MVRIPPRRPFPRPPHGSGAHPRQELEQFPTFGFRGVGVLECRAYFVLFGVEVPVFAIERISLGCGILPEEECLVQGVEEEEGDFTGAGLMAVVSGVP